MSGLGLARSAYYRVHRSTTETRDRLVSHLTRLKLCRSRRRQLQAAETALLDRRVRTPFEKSLVPIGNDRVINTLAMKNGCQEDDDIDGVSTLVLAHGFGSGLGFWWSNYDHLARMVHPERGPIRVLAFDWQGMGLSSRVPFVKRSSKSGENVMNEAEDYFIESLEAWRSELGLKRFTLLGHSLGGYLSSLYATRYPERVSNLVLASPVGLPDVPTEVTSMKPASELTFGSRLILSAWSNNVTPQRIIRASGPFGMKLVTRIIDARFRGLSTDERALIATYFHLMCQLEPSGEYALNALLRPVLAGPHRGVFAHRPIGQQLLNADRKVTILFGDHDWMFHPLVRKSPLMRHENVRFEVLPKAGHHLYLDNADAFHEIIRTSMNLQ